MTTRRATGLLAHFDEAGVLAPADVHVAARLGELTGETDDRVLLALALTVRSTRLGSVVFDLADAAENVTPDVDETATEESPSTELAWPEPEGWLEACRNSPLVAPAEGGSPVHIVDSRLWLDRYWKQERLVADELLARVADAPDDLDAAQLEADLDVLFPSEDDTDQRTATAVAAGARVSVISGGPGTGKTTTIARLILALWRQDPELRVALAAPTARAAARVEEAIHTATVDDADRERLETLSASTIHRLLGWQPGPSSRFKHHRGNRLPFDVVIVDECSMISLTLMARLVEALGPSARLVLVGDPDQLTSVEAGAVLADLVEAEDSPLQRSVAALRTVRRFEERGPIAQLAEHVRAGRADEALDLLTAAPDGLVFTPVEDGEPITGAAEAALLAAADHELAVIEAARVGDLDAALRALDRHRLVCAHRAGPRGERWWSDAIERRLAAADVSLVPRLDGRYAGQPLLVTVNDYENTLYNGDVGVVVELGDELIAAFRRKSRVAQVPLVRLGRVQPMHAMTVHRAQGSQFERVTVLLPHADSPLATRQTFYTAITRAKQHVHVIGSADAVLACVRRPAARATGLRDRLAGRLDPDPPVSPAPTPRPHLRVVR